jgi:isopenicillin N synthase-like dioxygenase
MYLKNHGIPSTAVDRAFEIVHSSEGLTNYSLMSFSQKLRLKSKMPSHGISTAQTLATRVRIQKGTSSTFPADDRLDVVNQARGDFKETFNMGKFADAEYSQKLPPILMQRWPEIQGFQKQCHFVTLKVLTLFALALNVLVMIHILTIASS